MDFREIACEGGNWRTFHDKTTLRISQRINYIRNLSIHIKNPVIKPIYKKGMKDDANNYHPIIFIPALSKILQKNNSNSANFFFRQTQHTLSQFGFRKNKSSNDATDTIIVNIIDKLKNETKCNGVL
jgi:hypothetical protein